MFIIKTSGQSPVLDVVARVAEIFIEKVIAAMGMKYLCVYDGNVYEIPVYKIKDGKFPKKELAGKTVIMMEMIYETKNRRPYKIVRIAFDRVSFDEHGIYDVGKDDTSKVIDVKLEYMYSRYHKSTEPLPIPIAPVIPTDEEVNIIKEHLRKKYPVLYQNSSNVIEEWIQDAQEQHQKEIRMMKESHRENMIKNNGYG